MDVLSCLRNSDPNMDEVSTSRIGSETHVFWIKKESRNESKVISCKFDSIDLNTTDGCDSFYESGKRKADRTSNHDSDESSQSIQPMKTDPGSKNPEMSEITESESPKECCLFNPGAFTFPHQRLKLCSQPDLGKSELGPRVGNAEGSETVESSVGLKVFESTLSDELHLDPLATTKRLDKFERSDMSESSGLCKRVQLYDSEEFKVHRRHSYSTSYQSYEDENFASDWREVVINLDNPKAVIGIPCKIRWPLDDKWYSGIIYDYNSISKKHQVIYKNFENEWLGLKNERIKLNLNEYARHPLVESFVRKIKREVCSSPSLIKNKTTQISHGSIVWGKVKGFSLWPALVVGDEEIKSVGLSPIENATAVQFFGTYDFLQFKRTNLLYTFDEGQKIQSKSKSKNKKLIQGILEAENYLQFNKLPERMILFTENDELNDSSGLSDDEEEEEEEEEDDESDEEEDEDKSENEYKNHSSSYKKSTFLENKFKRNKKRKDIKNHDDIFSDHERKKKRKKNDLGSNVHFPLKLRKLTIHKIGRIVTDSTNFQSFGLVMPENFSSSRILPSFQEPNKLVEYRMKIVRNPITNSPLFQITPSDSDTVENENLVKCWNSIARKIFLAKKKFGEKFKTGPNFENAAFQFGITHPKVLAIIQQLEQEAENKLVKLNSPTQFTSNKDKNENQNFVSDSSEIFLSNGSKPIIYSSHNNDLCDICFQKEEYEDNQMLQCDICRVMVHMHCYGVFDLPDGDLWLCTLCKFISKSKNKINGINPNSMRVCCLCPVLGGAMKQTTTEKFAHVVCSIWIPEVCLIKEGRNEMIHGIKTIKKGRWNLQCSICHIKYGACIQCSYKSCCVAYHPLCARNAGLPMELEEVVDGMPKKSGAVNLGDVQLLTYCRRHKNAANTTKVGSKCLSANKNQHPVNSAPENVVENNPKNFEPPKNISGCARTEPFNFSARRGLIAPEAIAAAQLKRKYIENNPYIISGMKKKHFFLHGNLTESMWSFHWGKKKPKLDTKLENSSNGESSRQLEKFILEEENLFELILEPHELKNFINPSLKKCSNKNSCQSSDSDCKHGQIDLSKKKRTSRKKRKFNAEFPNLDTVDSNKSTVAKSNLHSILGNGIETVNEKKERSEIVCIHDNMNSPDGVNYYEGLLSISDRFRRMKSTRGLRLTFGKSAIHGWGVFTKVKHKAKDMIIEYVGDIIRPVVADLREKKIYDSIVGAGTYMFRIDNEKVVDATKAGSIAHLINHSCTPNCYSRIIFASGEEHIIIFAKRDIEVGEEITYDYRFFSRSERLSCNCGSDKCRGVVNIEEEDPSEAALVLAPMNEVRFFDF